MIEDKEIKKRELKDRIIVTADLDEKMLQDPEEDKMSTFL